MAYSDSDSDHRSSRKSRRDKERRHRSSSSSSSSSSSDSSSRSRSSKDSRYHKRRRSSSRSRRKRSRSDSRDRRRDRREKRRSRSRSNSRKNRDRRRRRSRSRDTGRTTRRRSNSPENLDRRRDEKTPKEKLDKIKLQMVQQAANRATAEISKDPSSSLSPMSTLEQAERVKAIEDINSSSFVAQSFVSKRNVSNKDASKQPSALDSHDSAIFGSCTLEEFLAQQSKNPPKLTDYKSKPELLVHPDLYSDKERRMDKWRKKLQNDRRKLLNSMK